MKSHIYLGKDLPIEVTPIRKDVMEAD